MLIINHSCNVNALCDLIISIIFFYMAGYYTRWCIIDDFPLLNTIKSIINNHLKKY